MHTVHLFTFAVFASVAFIAPQCKGLNIISRDGWGALPPKSPPEMLPKRPTDLVIIHHGATRSCNTTEDCVKLVKAYQNYHMVDRKWNDIGYNFVVGEDGNVYEGRGWNIVGAHTAGMNIKSVGICVIGNFMDHVPNGAALTAVKELIEFGVTNKYIEPKYRLSGHEDFSATSCPGDKFYEEIKKWPGYSKTVSVTE